MREQGRGARFQLVEDGEGCRKDSQWLSLGRGLSAFDEVNEDTRDEVFLTSRGRAARSLRVYTRARARETTLVSYERFRSGSVSRILTEGADTHAERRGVNPRIIVSFTVVFNFVGSSRPVYESGERGGGGLRVKAQPE